MADALLWIVLSYSSTAGKRSVNDFRPCIENVRQLMQDARRHVNGALGALLNAYRPLLWALADEELNPELRAKANPSDLVQETFLEAQRDFGRFPSNDEGAFRAWLITLLLNNLSDFRRRYLIAHKRAVGLERQMTDPTSQLALITLAARAISSPSRDAMTREEVTRLESALARLSPEHLKIIEWRNRDGLRFAEIGSKLGRSADAARMLWNRALHSLRQELRNER